MYLMKVIGHVYNCLYTKQGQERCAEVAEHSHGRGNPASRFKTEEEEEV